MKRISEQDRNAKAVLANPELAKEIVKRGHEATAHGMSWSSQYNMTREQEK